MIYISGLGKYLIQAQRQEEFAVTVHLKIGQAHVYIISRQQYPSV